MTWPKGPRDRAVGRISKYSKEADKGILQQTKNDLSAVEKLLCWLKEKVVKDEERRVTTDFCVSAESGLNNPDSPIFSPASQAYLFQAPFVLFPSSFWEDLLNKESFLAQPWFKRKLSHRTGKCGVA